MQEIQLISLFIVLTFFTFFPFYKDSENSGKIPFYMYSENSEKSRSPKGERDGNILYYSVL